MKKLKFDNYIVVAKTIKTNSNYDLSVQVFEDNLSNLICGTILKRGTKDIDILDYAISSIKKPLTELF